MRQAVIKPLDHLIQICTYMQSFKSRRHLALLPTPKIPSRLAEHLVPEKADIIQVLGNWSFFEINQGNFSRLRQAITGFERLNSFFLMTRWQCWKISTSKRLSLSRRLLSIVADLTSSNNVPVQRPSRLWYNLPLAPPSASNPGKDVKFIFLCYQCPLKPARTQPRVKHSFTKKITFVFICKNGKRFDFEL